MVRKTVLALMAVAGVPLAAPTAASARGGFGGFHGGGFHGGGFHGGGWRRAGFGALGFGVGLGLAAPYAYGGYYGPGYGYGYGYPYSYAGYGGYYDEGGCYLVNRRIWTSYGWRLRRVEVCR
jgi:hypothetical protein